jgi:hypothetical protein
MTERSQIVAVLRALEEGWALVDDADSSDYMVLRNEDRDELEHLQPTKTLVRLMENESLIEDRHKPTERDFSSKFEWDRVTGRRIETRIPNPIVYAYTVTSKGRKLLHSHTDGAGEANPSSAGSRKPD